MTPSTLTPLAWQHFLDLLPWYANGTIGAEDQREMERCLAMSAECRAELEELRTLMRALRSETVTMDERASLDRLMAMVHAQSSGRLLVLPTRASSGVHPHNNVARWYKPILAVAATIALFQVGSLFLHPEEDRSVLRPLGARPQMARQAMIQATFRADASEVQIRELLARIGAEIVSGPGALGVYTLKISAHRADAALAELRRATRIVDSAAPLAN